MVEQEGKDTELYLNVYKEELRQYQKVQSKRFKDYKDSLEGNWDGVDIEDTEVSEVL